MDQSELKLVDRQTDTQTHRQTDRVITRGCPYNTSHYKHSLPLQTLPFNDKGEKYNSVYCSFLTG